MSASDLKPEDLSYVCPVCRGSHPWADTVLVFDGKSGGGGSRARMGSACLDQLKQQDLANNEPGRHFADHERTAPAAPPGRGR